jgi:putative transposase
MSQTYHSLAPSRWACTDPVGGVPQRRRTPLFGPMRHALGPIVHDLARHKECRIIAGPWRPAQVHLGMAIPPQHAGASVLGDLTGKRARARARQFAGGDRTFAGAPFWARGYAVSPGGFELAPVRASSREQEEADGQGRVEPLHQNRPPLRRSRSSSHRLCRGCLTGRPQG